MVIEGMLLDIEHKNGTFTPQGSTESIDYDNFVAHMIVGKRVVKVKARGEDRARISGLREKIGQKVSLDVLLPEQLNIAPLS